MHNILHAGEGNTPPLISSFTPLINSISVRGSIGHPLLLSCVLLVYTPLTVIRDFPVTQIPSGLDLEVAHVVLVIAVTFFKGVLCAPCSVVGVRVVCVVKRGVSPSTAQKEDDRFRASEEIYDRGFETLQSPFLLIDGVSICYGFVILKVQLVI